MGTWIALLSLVLLGLVDPGQAGNRSATWDYCECWWGSWNPWSDCTNTCFGIRKRYITVHFTQHDGCDEYIDCGTPDSGIETDRCNTVCHNRGSRTQQSYHYDSDFGRLFIDPCSCSSGYRGDCCTERVDCGYPDSIANGNVNYPNTYYGARATYSCNRHYSLTDGSTSRSCQHSGSWSGQKPRCAYVNHCSSGPCRNGARCTDLLDDYRCTCNSGWSGRHCENDVQPPVMLNCPTDKLYNATTHTLQITWEEPKFMDPMQTDIRVTANYASPQFTFPWGDFTVQYVAIKPRNGLQTECRFQISVRPTPCPEMNVPTNGARLCNGWRTDYGRLCLVACRMTHTIDARTFSFGTFHACGASGSWLPSGHLPDCDIHMADPADITAGQPKYPAFSYNSTCTDGVTMQSLQNLYVGRISNSVFSDFCSRYPDECLPDNVQVVCNS